MNTYAWALIAAFISATTPVTLLLMREVIRRRRSAMLTELLDSLFKGKPDIPTLEFARKKYAARSTSQANTDADDEALRRHLIQTWRLFVSAIPYLVFSVGGFILLMEPIANLIASTVEDPSARWIRPTFFWTEKAAETDGDLAQLLRTVAVAGVAFLGAYLFTLRNLLRAVLNFELSPITWLRASVHLLSGVVVAVVGYRALHATPFLASVVGQSGSSFGVWLALAFIVGLTPDLGLTTMVRYLHIHYLKSVDSEVIKSVSIVPIEIIDGIDYNTRYRLEEGNIVDVQNLATYNPILLFVETPYGLYESFDWVLQAQLCLVVGPKTFLELKRHNIRTIFDLERAVLGDLAPDPYVRMVGRLLYANADPNVRELLCVAPTSGAPPQLDVQSIKHAVMVMLDDLHIHRLRQLWDEISKKLGREWLYRSSSSLASAGAPAATCACWAMG
jgi:hypothetical protein